MSQPNLDKPKDFKALKKNAIRYADFIVIAQGRLFGFSISNASRGDWLYNLVIIDDQLQADNTCDARTEREARYCCRQLAENGYMDPKWGWCSKSS